MTKKIIKSVVITGLLLSASTNSLFAKEELSKESLKLINVAGKQRMLSQKIVKDYLYMGKNIAKNKARKELKKSLVEFNEGKQYILSVTNDEKTKNLVSFIDMSLEEFVELSQEKFGVDNAKIAMDLSESILEGSQFIVDNLDKKNDLDETMKKAFKQRMLAQRIAKYYIAYQNGVKDANTVTQIKNAVTEFTENHEFLLKSELNTPEINKKLKAVGKLWTVVYKFYNDIEEGGLPFIVFTSTDKISKEMNKVTDIYSKNKN